MLVRGWRRTHTYKTLTRHEMAGATASGGCNILQHNHCINLPAQRALGKACKKARYKSIQSLLKDCHNTTVHAWITENGCPTSLNLSSRSGIVRVRIEAIFSTNTRHHGYHKSYPRLPYYIHIEMVSDPHTAHKERWHHPLGGTVPSNSDLHRNSSLYITPAQPTRLSNPQRSSRSAHLILCRSDSPYWWRRPHQHTLETISKDRNRPLSQHRTYLAERRCIRTHSHQARMTYTHFTHIVTCKSTSCTLTEIPVSGNLAP